MADIDDSEKKLLDSLSKRRRVIKQSLAPLTKGGRESPIELQSTTSLGTEDLLGTMKERRLKRKGMLPPINKDKLQDISMIPPLPPLPDEDESSIGVGPLTSTVYEPPAPQPASSSTGSVIRRLREQNQRTRFDDLVMSPSHQRPLSPSPAQTMMAVGNRNVSQRWKNLSTKLSDVTEKMERERSLEFFMSSSPIHETQESERAVEGERPIEEVVDGQAEQGGEEEEDHEDNVQEQEAFIVSERTLPQKYCYPKYTPYRDRIREEKKFYFTNNRTLAPFESKLPQGTQPFFAEDSGLYAGRRPQVTIGNLAAMENRLLQRPDKGEGWFGKDGLLLTTFKPLKELITRPLIVLEDGGQHHYKPYQIPKVADGNKRYVKSDGAIHQCILELFLGSMSFGHHPMYSLEHVLSGVMERLCTEYNQIDRERVINQHRQKLQALQISAWNLRQKLSELQKSMQSQPSGQLQKELTTSKMHLNHYNIEIRFTRQSIKQMAAAEYRLTQNILEKWREIKTLRNEQGYVCTDVELTVHKVETDAANEQIQLERDIECELHEMREDYESSIEEEMRQYAARLNEWKMHEKERRKIVRQMTNQSFQAPSPEVEGEKENVPETEGGTSQSSSAVMPPHKRPKPVAPPSFDEEGARQGLVDYYHHSHRRPGYPRLIPHLTHNHHITQHVSKEEQRRREAIRHMRYKIKVLYNDKEVYTTSEKHHEGHSFTITFNELLNINIVEIPNTIELQIHIMGSLFSFSDVVKVYIPVPDSGVTSSCTHCDPYQFSSNHPVSYIHHTGVGSGHIHPNYPQGGELTTSGHIAVAICWSEGPDGQPLCPANIKKEKLDQLSYIGVAGINSAYKLKKWIEEAHIDPNDPRNWDILELIESLPDTCEEPKYFRLMKMDKDAQFVEKEEFDNNRRFVLLKMRSQGWNLFIANCPYFRGDAFGTNKSVLIREHPALKGFSIPLNEDCITDSLWKSVCDHKPHGLADLPVSIFGNFYEGKRSIRLQYLNEVRQKVLERSGTHPTTELTLDDIITKDTIPTISSLRNTLVNLFSPHRPLRPKRIVRRKPKPLNVHVTSCHVTVRVVMAINVPLREGHEGRRDKCPVKSFVRIQFGKETARTETAYGPHPHWNEELVLPFHPPDDDFSPAALLKVSDDLILHLYDEVMVNMITDERQKDSDIHMKIEKKWLGSLTIPFSTLHSHSRIEGTFQLDTPPIILGYDWTPPSQNLVEDSSKTFLQLFISLEPPLSTLPPITDRFDSIEDSSLLEKARIWLNELKSKHPNRIYTATALDVNGRTIFITRFIKPQNPPQCLLPDDYQALQLAPLLRCMEKLAWFVSLIPFLPDAVLYSGTCDIWASSDLFLRMLGGDEEEHAVLLCNYFLFIGQEAWVVIGTAIPEGSTAYVLTHHPLAANKYILWDPSNGRYFTNTLSHIPLTSIACIFNNDNVWGNIQEFDHPSRVNFDLQSNKKWSPLFQANMAPLNSVQVETLEYPATDEIKVQQLQTRLDQLIHGHIEKLRVRHLTKWNRYCCRLLQNTLPMLEENPFFAKNTLQEHKKEICENFNGFQINGYPFHIRYTDISQLLGAIESTNIHSCGRDKTEFALSVYIHSYPNDVLSLWVYLAVMNPL